jgi:hypothetical protein
MTPSSTTVTLPNGNQITLISGHPSVRVLVWLLGSRGYSVEVRLFPLNVLSLVPAVDRSSSFFFRDALLTVHAPAVALGVSAPLSDSEESSTSEAGQSNDDLPAVDPDLPGLGRNC